MRNKFREFYHPTEEEIGDFWENAFFSFDANVLLNLYRYSENTRDDILAKLEYLSSEGRLWLSYQAVFEYQNNRLNAIDAMKKAYDSLQENLKKRMNELESDLNDYKKHPYLKIEEIKEAIKEKYEEIKSQIDDLKESHPDFINDDPIFDKLTEIFENCIGEALTKDQLSAIYKEGKERYEKKVPPGYADKAEKEKNGEQSLYGDLIIWKELLTRFKGNDDKLIFVTDDLKEDWWFKFNGKTIRPRRELIREFIDETTKPLLIYKPEQFLQYAKSNLEQEVHDETIEEVEQVRKDDEDFNEYLKSFLKYPDPNLLYPTNSLYSNGPNASLLYPTNSFYSNIPDTHQTLYSQSVNNYVPRNFLYNFEDVNLPKRYYPHLNNENAQYPNNPLYGQARLATEDIEKMGNNIPKQTQEGEKNNNSE